MKYHQSKINNIYIAILVILTSCNNPSSPTIVEENPVDSIEVVVVEKVIKNWRELPLDSVYEIDLSDQGLTELPDLTMYPNLKSLDLSHNQIVLEDPLDCQRLIPGIDSMKFYGNSQLESLNLSNNNIDFFATFPITQCHPNLKHLDLSNNHIKRFYGLVYHSENPVILSKVNLSNNKLEEVNISFYMDTLDLSQNPILTGEQMVMIERVSKIQLNGCDTISLLFKDSVIRTYDVCGSGG